MSSIQKTDDGFVIKTDLMEISFDKVIFKRCSENYHFGIEGNPSVRFPVDAVDALDEAGVPIMSEHLPDQEIGTLDRSIIEINRSN